jgi:hypothetical protein
VNLPDTRRVVDFVCGSENVLCVLESEGHMEVWGWGWNEHGNLATGSLDDVKVPITIWPLSPAQTGEKVVGMWVQNELDCGVSYGVFLRRAVGRREDESERARLRANNIIGEIRCEVQMGAMRTG